MSIKTFFTSVEEGAVKIVTFLVKEMSFAEEVLGAGTGSAKENVVITAVESLLSNLGVPVGAAEAELKAVTDALVALLNKVGLFDKPAAPPPAA